MSYAYTLFVLLWKLNLIPPVLLTITVILLSVTFKFHINNSIKINNFYLAHTALIVYIIVFIFLLLTMRIYQIGNSLNLKELWSLITSFFINVNELSFYYKYIAYTTIIIIILGWLLIIIKLRKILTNEIWKLFMYYTFINKSYNTPPKYPKIYESAEYLASLLDLNNLAFKLNALSKKILGSKLTDNLNLYTYILIILPSLLFFLTFLVEIYVNKFIIHYIFYYLPFYLIILSYLQIAQNMSWYVCDVAIIVMEREYNYPQKIYVNIDAKTEAFLQAYIDKNKKIFNISNPLFNLKNEYGHPIEFYNKFELIDNKSWNLPTNVDSVYLNEHRQLYFETNKIKIADGKFFVDE